MNKQNLFYLVFDNLNNLYKRLSVFLMEQQPQLLVNDYFFFFDRKFIFEMFY